MPTYSLYGLNLHSELPLEELREVEAPVGDCRLRVRNARFGGDPGRPMGEEAVFGDVRVRSYDGGSWYRLVYDDTGTFEIRRDGQEIVWWSGDHAPDQLVETDVLGRVLAFVLHCRGVLTLHASAVCIGDAGVAFLAPKYHGKSTLAAALVGAGARLVSDDTVAVALESTATLLPGVQTVRLWRDTARAQGVGADGDEPKVRFRPPPPEAIGSAFAALDALYLLRPADAAAEAARRTRCLGADALLGVVSQRKLGFLLDGSAAAASLEAAVRLVSAVPVFELHVARDLGKLSAACDLLRGWHDGSAASPGRAGARVVAG